MRQHFRHLLKCSLFLGVDCSMLKVVRRSQDRVSLQVFASMMDKDLYFPLPLLQNPALSDHP